MKLCMAAVIFSLPALTAAIANGAVRDQEGSSMVNSANSKPRRVAKRSDGLSSNEHELSSSGHGHEELKYDDQVHDDYDKKVITTYKTIPKYFPVIKYRTKVVKVPVYEYVEKPIYTYVEKPIYISKTKYIHVPVKAYNENKSYGDDGRHSSVSYVEYKDNYKDTNSYGGDGEKHY